ncbi:MAG: glycosyltransferase [Lacunisphaera sp.]|nr:glycosyltransferase [Lacunisphaera sp.]
MRELPRLACITEVPPVNLSAGPAVLYRLLKPYPADRLLLCLDQAEPRWPGRELEGVERAGLHFGWRRLQRSRFGRWHGTLVLLFQSVFLTGPLVRRLRAFRAEAVLTVAHGTVWWPAWLAARRLGLPFHLIVHDHWRDSYDAHRWTGGFAEKRFAAVYRGATSRLLVSETMARKYQSRYGAAPATLLYPSQLASAELHGAPPERPAADRPFVIAYAGGMDGQWAKDAVVALAHAVAPLGARVRVYQTISLDSLRAADLRTDNVEIQTFLPALELHRHLRQAVDALYLPMSFTASDRRNMEVCFPSKLVDYTMPGLPILVRAPAYSSIAHWLAGRPGTALAVETEDAAALCEAVRSLMTDAALWQRLGCAALAAGRECFSVERVFGTFTATLHAANPVAA